MFHCCPGVIPGTTREYFVFGGVQVPGATQGPGGALERRPFLREDEAFSTAAYGLSFPQRALLSAKVVDTDPAIKREPKDFIILVYVLLCVLKSIEKIL
jgi:hypothetical protein